MRENRLYGSVGGWGLIAPRLPNQSRTNLHRRSPGFHARRWLMIKSVTGQSPVLLSKECSRNVDVC
jgi:hypothetical protein